MLAGHRPARRKGTALGGDALDVAPQFDFLGQQRGTGGAIGGILVVDADGIAARQLRGRGGRHETDIAASRPCEPVR